MVSISIPNLLLNQSELVHKHLLSAIKREQLLNSLGLELAIDLPPPRGNLVHYNFLKLYYIRHKIKDVSPLRVAALT